MIYTVSNVPFELGAAERGDKMVQKQQKNHQSPRATHTHPAVACGFVPCWSIGLYYSPRKLSWVRYLRRLYYLSTRLSPSRAKLLTDGHTKGWQRVMADVGPRAVKLRTPPSRQRGLIRRTGLSKINAGHERILTNLTVVRQ